MLSNIMSQNEPLIYPEFNSNYTNVLLIDKQVPNYNQFINSANSFTYPILYSYSSTKVDLLNILRNFTSICRLGIVFTSTNNTKLFLDYKPFFITTEVKPYSENTEFIINIIKEFNIKHIDYLACNTLNYSRWINYYSILQSEFDIIIGASNDKTGNIKYGGDWVMESTSQNIENIYFTTSIEYYKYLLDIPINTDHILYNFTSSDGGDSRSTGVFDGSTLYGINQNSIYSYDIISNSFNIIYNTYDYILNSQSLPILNNNILYSTGLLSSNSNSILYSYNLITNTFNILHTFNNDDMWDVILNDSILYGVNMTDTKERYLYAFNIITSIYTHLYTFIDINIYNSFRSILFYNSHLLYGTSLYGGLNDAGYIYTFDIISLEFNIVYDFTYSLGYPRDFAISGSTIYGLAFDSIYSYDIITQVFTILYSEIVSYVPSITLNNNIIYGIEYNGGSNNVGSIFSYNLYTDKFITQYSFSGSPDGNDPWGQLIFNDGVLYGTTVLGGSENYGILYSFIPSDICLIGSTPINTDQGIIRIDQLDTFNTIKNRPIIAITKTLCQDKYLVCFEKNALGKNYPSEDTIMSLGHCVKYNGQMIKAKNLVGKNSKIYKILSKSECLYNILMNKYQTIIVNNLIVETLHPNNKIAQKILNKTKKM
jgi:hypothetical protein